MNFAQLNASKVAPQGRLNAHTETRYVYVQGETWKDGGVFL